MQTNEVTKGTGQGREPVKKTDDLPKIMFMVDAEEDPAQMANLGDIYTDASPLLAKHFFNMPKPVIEKTFYQDQWGIWLSGYAPFYDSEGRRAGVLGVDISAETVKKYQKHILMTSLIIFLMILPFVIVAAFLLGRGFGAPIVMMQRGAQAISSGNLDYRLKVPMGRELSVLAKSMNQMAVNLKQEQNNLKRMVTKYRNIFQNATDGIFQTTPEGKLITANNAMVNMLGYTSLDELQDAIDNHIVNIYQNPKDRQKILRQLKNQDRLSGVEVPLKQKDGSIILTELNVHLGQ